MASEQDLINKLVHSKKQKKTKQHIIVPIVESRPHLGSFQRFAMIDNEKHCVSVNGDVPFTVTSELECFPQADVVPEQASAIPIELPRSEDQHKVALGIDNVFTEAECQEMIELMESCGFGLIVAPWGKEMNPQLSERISQASEDPVTEVEIFPGRIVHAVRVYYTALADFITNRVQSFLPAHVESWGSLRGIVPETMAFLRYGPNEGGGVHRDSQYINTEENRISRLSCMLYLNDNCEGGDFRIKNLDGLEDLDIPVGAGKVLAFEHDILHQGTKVYSGHKYAIKMDIEYVAEHEITD